MKRYEQLTAVLPDQERAVALGLFDGLHLGHQAVIRAALSHKQEGLSPAVFTYRIQGSIPSQKRRFRWICSEEERARLLEQMGVEVVVQPTFEDFRDMASEDFVENFLLGQMRAKVICCGEDFRFGKGAAGTVETLRRLCEPRGVRLELIPPVELEGERISSTRIRDAIEAGDMPLTQRLLGRPYSISSLVESGNHLGRTLSFPTINQPYPQGFAVPRYGVYLSAALVGGQLYPAISNVGVKPTVGGHLPLAETNILGFSGDLYGTRVLVCLCRFLRPEQRFGGLEELRAQISRDVAVAQKEGPALVKELEKAPLL